MKANEESSGLRNRALSNAAQSARNHEEAQIAQTSDPDDQRSGVRNKLDDLTLTDCPSPLCSSLPVAQLNGLTLADLGASLEDLGKELEAFSRRTFHFTKADAEDIRQQAFTRMLGPPPVSCNNKAGLRSYAFEVARNLCLDKLRKDRVRRVESSDSIDQIDQIDHRVGRVGDARSEYEDRQLLIETLKNAYRGKVLVLTLLTACGYEDNEIAEIMGTTKNKVKSATHKMRERLGRTHQIKGKIKPGALLGGDLVYTLLATLFTKEEISHILMK